MNYEVKNKNKKVQLDKTKKKENENSTFYRKKLFRVQQTPYNKKFIFSNL